jgi:Ca2+-binding EF-hand superfamily protein
MWLPFCQNMSDVERTLFEAFCALDKDNNTYITFDELKVEARPRPSVAAP